MSTHFTWQSAVLDSDCESTTKYVLLVVGTYMNQHGSGAFPSYSTIAQKASLGRSTVIKHIDIASAKGWIRKTVRPKGNMDNETNLYAIAFPQPSPSAGLGGGIPGGPASPYGGLDLVHTVDPNTPVLTPQVTPKEPLSGKPDCAREILAFLNDATNSNYRPVPSNLSKIEARLNEGATVDEIQRVITRKAAEWLGTTMEKYLRPDTLFNATKYNQYVGQLGKPIVRHGTDDRMAQMKLVADELTGRSTSYDDDADNPFTIEAAARRIA